MLPHEGKTLLWLAVLVSLGLTEGQITTDYIRVQTPMPWTEAREFCQKHYVDLAVLSTEEQYFTVRTATASSKASFWLGLQRQSLGSSWKWVSGEELGYKQWYNNNYEGRCASLEAMLKKDQKLLPRLCNEPHMALCQGPVSPQSVTVSSVGAHRLNLSWNVSSFMQMTPHGYNLTVCTNTCETLLYSYPGGSALMNIDVSNLTSCTEYSVAIAAFVVRPDSRTGEEIILQDEPTTLQVKTGGCHDWKKLLCFLLKLLKLASLAPPLWVLYHIFKKVADDCLEPDHEISAVLTTEE
ncbi:uncharacterized protein LOC115398538 [Salarias fasciatus]|uniref:uncharacterized protein LOC115398538 n=1 Tax=Salarias fasciatus TaxID=181472 RepID=UPI0011767853|nr:uncharacterized protein LOC115398538 [Salarias fasciatus]